MNGDRFFLALCLSCLAVPAFAAPAASFLAPGAYAELMASGELRASSTGKEAGLSLAFSHPALAAIKADLASEGPDLVVEALFSWKKPRSGDRGAELLAAYNVIRSIGSMKGIEYYSASRKAMRLFYEESSLASGPDGKVPLPDSPRAALPASERLFARQKDLSFGDNVYRIDLRTGPDYVLSVTTNLTAMRYGILPVAGPERLTVRVLIVVADDAILFYVMSSARVAVIPGMRGKLEDSFGNRAAAVFAWFGRKAEERWRSF